MWNNLFWYNFANPPSADTSLAHTQIQTHRGEMNRQKQTNTCAHWHTRTHTHTLRAEYWDSQTEVYIISLGGQPEQTQSFNFHDSQREQARGEERKKSNQWELKDKSKNQQNINVKKTSANKLNVQHTAITVCSSFQCSRLFSHWWVSSLALFQLSCSDSTFMTVITVKWCKSCSWWQLL